MKLTSFCAAAILILAAMPAEAQLCAGAPSFTEGPYQASFSGAFREGAQGVGGEFLVGGPSVFAGGGLAVTNFRDLDSTATTVSATIGAELAVEGDRRIFLCPIARFGFTTGPDVGPVDVSSFQLEAGGQLGVVANDANNVMIVPTFGLAAARQRVNATVRGVDRKTSDTFGLANLGVGFILNRRTAITPAVVIPFSSPNSDAIFVLTFSFNFGQ